jgi:Ca-activated chloride channel family protein
MSTLTLAAPEWLLALVCLPMLWLWRRRRGHASVWLVPYAANWAGQSAARPPTPAVWAAYGALVLVVVALARPQTAARQVEPARRGYDIMLAIDLSSSMLAEDYAGPNGVVNRIDTVRPVLRRFIADRPADRIGVVAFAGKALTLAPPTTAHDWLAEKVGALKVGLIEDGTAVGDGVGLALANLERRRGNSETDSQTDGAFVILLTDGANTSGSLTPPQATAIARHRKIPIYTIGAGRTGMVPFPIFNDAGRRIGTRQFPSSIDENALRIMADETGGRAFKADDATTVAAAFRTIDAAQKATFEPQVTLTMVEHFEWAAFPALVLALAALALEARRRSPSGLAK